MMPPAFRICRLAWSLEFHKGPGRLALTYECNIRPTDTCPIELGYNRQSLIQGQKGEEIREQFLECRGKPGFRDTRIRSKKVADAPCISFQKWFGVFHVGFPFVFSHFKVAFRTR